MSGDTSITNGERTAVTQTGAKGRAEEQDVRKVFETWDTNGDGVLNLDELCTVLTALDPEKWTDDQIGALYKMVDTNGDGKVNVEEFVNWSFTSDTIMSNRKPCRFGIHCRDQGDAKHCAMFSHAHDPRRRHGGAGAHHGDTHGRQGRSAHAGRKIPCRHGSACRDQHDEDHCARFSHPEALTPCKYGAHCRQRFQKKHCAMYAHPTEVGTATIPCRYGAKCTRAGCMFSHPAKTSSGAKDAASELDDLIKEVEAGGDSEEEADHEHAPAMNLTSEWKPSTMPQYATAPTAAEAQSNIQTAAAAGGVGTQQEYEREQYNTFVQNTTATGNKAEAGSCMQLMHGPGAPGGCTMTGSHPPGAGGFHFWLCHHCSTVQYWGYCVNGCDWGKFGWTCIDPLCKGSDCGCKKGRDYWRDNGRNWLVKT
mmetsp:Transcript_5480/g.10442  ORF Transcript_5480/g.10442 Transcript_5480/m.10442 type:complete len:423 (-) Transcript_5480:68-1336(-)